MFASANKPLHLVTPVFFFLQISFLACASPTFADIFQLRGEATIRTFGSNPPAFGQVGERISMAVDINTATFNYRPVANEAFHIFNSFIQYPTQVIGEQSGTFPTIKPVDGLTVLEVTDSVQSDLFIVEGFGGDVLEFRCRRNTCFEGRVKPFTTDEAFAMLYQAVTDTARWRLPSTIPSLVFENSGEQVYLQDVSWTVNVMPGPVPTQLDIVAAADADYEAVGSPNLELNSQTLLVGHAATEMRSLLEFSLADIPVGADLQSVQLELDGFVSSGAPRIEIVAFQGDGSISTADISASGTVVASSLEMSLSTGLIFDLDAEHIESMLGSSTHLGLRMRGLGGIDYVGFKSTESTLADPTPTLTVRYLVAEVPGDFDGDSDVDGVDFLHWQRGESPTALGTEDYQAWESNFGATAA